MSTEIHSKPRLFSPLFSPSLGRRGVRIVAGGADQGLWIIPANMVKQLKTDMRRKHQLPKNIPPYILPLSVQAIEIVRYLLEEFKPAQRYLLHGDVDIKSRISAPSTVR